MRPSEPRIAPLPEQEWTAEQRELLDQVSRGGRVFNVFATLVRHPRLFKRWTPFAGHLLYTSSLTARDRELLILRTAWLAQAEYEWGQHVEIAKRCGLSPAEIERVALGPDAKGWSAAEAALLTAADDLFGDACLSDASWKALSARYDTAQLLDIIFTVGHYAMLAMALNSLGVRLDEGIKGFAPP
jgi:4-carboxymuconolactone decarboxylase